MARSNDGEITINEQDCHFAHNLTLHAYDHITIVEAKLSSAENMKLVVDQDCDMLGGLTMGTNAIVNTTAGGNITIWGGQIHIETTTTHIGKFHFYCETS